MCVNLFFLIQIVFFSTAPIAEEPETLETQNDNPTEATTEVAMETSESTAQLEDEEVIEKISYNEVLDQYNQVKIIHFILLHLLFLF